jgi:hypothetical protein
MDKLLYYSIFFSAMCALYGFLLSRQSDKKFYLYIGLAGAMLIHLGTMVFLLGNIGKNVALHKFEFGGLDIVLYTSIALTLLSGILGALQRKLWPHGVMAVLSILQIVFVFALKLYFSR